MTDEEIVEIIVKNVFEPMRGKLSRPLTSMEAEGMFRLRRSPIAHTDETYDTLLKSELAVQVIDKRRALFTVPIEKRVLLCIAALAIVPADIVLYLSYTVWFAREVRRSNLGRPITMDHFMARTITGGLLSPEDMSALQSACKLREEGHWDFNALDTQAIVDFLNSPKVQAT